MYSAPRTLRGWWLFHGSSRARFENLWRALSTKNHSHDERRADVVTTRGDPTYLYSGEPSSHHPWQTHVHHKTTAPLSPGIGTPRGDRTLWLHDPQKGSPHMRDPVGHTYIQGLIHTRLEFPILHSTGVHVSRMNSSTFNGISIQANILQNSI